MVRTPAEDLPSLQSASHPPEILGLATLATAAYRGAGPADLARMIEAHGGGPAATLHDTAAAFRIIGMPEQAAAMQSDAVAAAPVVRVAPPDAMPGHRPLRVLAMVAPGDLMANTPLDFITNHLQVRLDLMFVSPGRPLPETVPDHDVAFMAATAAGPGALARLEGLHRRWPRPMVNDPRLLPTLERDRLAAALGALPGVLTPPTALVGRADAERLAAGAPPSDVAPGAEYPLLARPAGSHAGLGLEKVDGPGHMRRFLDGTEAESLFLSGFVDYRGPDGAYRKLRVALVGGRPHLCHMATSSHWMVHYLNAGMAGDAAKRDGEARAMSGFGEGFARRHAAAFAAMSGAVPLDYWSVDCAEAPDGRLLVFEGDTAAIIHLMDDEATFPYKRPHMLRVFEDVGALLRARAVER